MELAQEIITTLQKYYNAETDSIELVDEKHDKRHWFLRVVSGQFEGKSRLERSRMIYEKLGHFMKDDHIHALRLELKTPQELNQ